MGISISYQPDANLVGRVAMEAGLGDYRQRQFENSMESARFAADQAQFAAKFMADQQQQAIENSMRSRQMAENAMQDRAQFGLRAAESRDQAARAWFNQHSDNAFRSAGLDWQREKFGDMDAFQREKLQATMEGYDRRNAAQKEMLEARIRGSMSLEEKKQAGQFDKMEAEVIAGIRGGRYTGQAGLQQLEKIRLAREGQFGEIAKRIEAEEANREVNAQKQYEMGKREHPDGSVERQRPDGTWQYEFHAPSHWGKRYGELMKELTTEEEIMSVGPDGKPVGTTRFRKVPPTPEKMRAALQQELETLKGLGLWGGQAKPSGDLAPPSQPQPREAVPPASLKGPVLGRKQQPPPVGPDVEQWEPIRRDASGAPMMPPKDRQVDMAMKNLNDVRQKFAGQPERQRDVDLIAASMTQYSSIADMPPDMQRELLAAIKRIEG